MRKWAFLVLFLPLLLNSNPSNIFGFYPSSGKSLFSEQHRFMSDLSTFVEILKQIEGLEFSGRELGRTIYQQRKYITLGLSKTLRSKHLEFLAIDMEFKLNGKLITHSSNKDDMAMMYSIGAIWEYLSLSNEAGVFWEFKDAGHFQRNRL